MLSHEAKSVPLFKAIGDASLPVPDFDLQAQVAAVPWWSVLQTVAWIVTGSKAYAAFVADLEGEGGDDTSTEATFCAVVVFIARDHCRCYAQGDPVDSRWERCECTGNAGRLLLEAIRVGKMSAIQNLGNGSQTVTFHDLAGIGNLQTCSDWVRRRPAISFSSAEAIGAFKSSFAPSSGLGGNVPPNRKLDHADIIGRVASMIEAQPGISKGSAAASIVADLPRNPTTGKPRDTRHIERIIAHLWEGEVTESPP
jgi:hypothetical protein